MTRFTVALLLLVATSAGAQAPIDPSGHWEATIEAPGLTLPLEIDLARDASGAIIATVNLPAESIVGLPMKVAIDGRSITLHARSDQGIVGTLAEDGRSIAAEFQTGGFSLPFTLMRTGDARIEPPARSAAISKALAGRWNATLQIPNLQMEFVLTLTNHADGTATGSLVTVNQGGLEIPVSAITQKASTVNLEMKAVGTTYAGALSADGSELVGTITQRGQSVPMTFHRAAPVSSR